MADHIVQDRPENSVAEVDESVCLVQQARRAMEEGDVERADKLARRAVRSETPHPGAWRLWVRSAFHQGHIDIALKRSRKALKAQPDDPQLHTIHVRIMAASGKPHHRTLKHVNQAIRRWPRHVPLKLVKLQVLQEARRTNQALKLLRNLRRRWPDNAAVLMAVARFYHAHGRFRAARTVLDHMLERHPQHRQARLMRQNLSIANSDDTQGPPSLPGLLAQAQQNPELSPTDAAEILQAIKLTTAPELTGTCQEAIDFVSDMVDQLAEGDKFALFTQAERFGQAEAAHRALTAIFNHGPRAPNVAKRLFQKALASIEPDQVDTVIAYLLRHIPKAKKNALLAEFALLTDGPQGALDQLRQERRRYRSLPEARELARFLRISNAYTLGLRYLRFCRRRWPDDADLRLLHARLLMDAGHPEAALTALDGPVPVAKRATRAHIRAHSLLEMGQLHAALSELDNAGTTTAAAGNLNMRMRILILQGRENEVMELIEDAQRRGVNNQLTSGHLSTSVFGNLISDLALYRRDQSTLPPGRHDGYLSAHYLHPASAVIHRHVEPSSPDPSRGERYIPLRVVQYWNERKPPKSVMDIMHSWSSLPGIEYHRFHTQSARFFLRHTFGADYERAFKQASNVAEGADFLRLCCLRHYGGLYADADDRLYGQLSALLPAEVGMVCFREPFDILANNVIAAAPEHPAIVLASEMAAEALLSHDNDNTWSKTGPGLLTRAIARYLVETEPRTPRERVAILPDYILRRQVQVHMPLPHKRTQRHWNATNTTGVNMKPFFPTATAAPLA